MESNTARIINTLWFHAKRAEVDLKYHEAVSINSLLLFKYNMLVIVCTLIKTVELVGV